MSQESKLQGGDLFIVDNSDQDWKVRRYLYDWTEIASSFDIATGYFEIGALLLLDQQWQKLDHLRILMGDEVSKRTKKALLLGLQEIKHKLDKSIEDEKEKNDFLVGVSAIVEALRNRQIRDSGTPEARRDRVRDYSAVRFRAATRWSSSLL